MAVRRRASRKLLLVTALFVGLHLLPSSASADIGLPMLFVVWPPLVLLLLPVIAIEASCAHRVLGLDWRRALSVSGRANLISTLLGVPLAWLLIVLLGLTGGWGRFRSPAPWPAARPRAHMASDRSLPSLDWG